MYDFLKQELIEIKKEIEEKLTEHESWEIFDKIETKVAANDLALFLQNEFPEFCFKADDAWKNGFLVRVSK